MSPDFWATHFPVPLLDWHIFLTCRSSTNTIAWFLLISFEDRCRNSFLMLAMRWCNLAIPAFAFFQLCKKPRHAALPLRQLRQGLLERLALLLVCAVRRGIQANHSPIQTHNVFHLVSGAIGLWARLRNNANAVRRFGQIFGAIYRLVAIRGFAALHDLGPIQLDLNMHFNFIHLGVGPLSLAAGLAGAAQQTEASSPGKLQGTRGKSRGQAIGRDREQLPSV